ncbi:MAG: putative metal-binding motif-containing protein [Myxococcota bacterium]
MKTSLPLPFARLALPLALLAPGCAWVPKSALDFEEPEPPELDPMLVDVTQTTDGCSPELELTFELDAGFAGETLMVTLSEGNAQLAQIEAVAEASSGIAVLTVTLDDFALTEPQPGARDLTVRVRHGSQDATFTVSPELTVEDWYPDADDDGAASGTPVYGCEPLGEPEQPITPDCDDSDPNQVPGGTEICDGLDNDCSGAPDADEADIDGDTWLLCVRPGAPTNDVDCNDDDPAVNPGALEVAGNDEDENCDGLIECFVDSDEDSFGDVNSAPQVAASCTELGFSQSQDDCNDAEATINPGALDTVADGIDQDCDGFDACYQDADGDGVGSMTIVPGSAFCVDPFESNRSDDCDDADGERAPDRTEIVSSGIDEDCDGMESCYEDMDGDGYGSSMILENATEQVSCIDGGVSPSSDDCDDNSVSIKPGAPEGVADGIDQDCDGVESCYEDVDLDGFGSAVFVPSTDWTCTVPGVSAQTGDCADDEPTVAPGHTEDCDGIANDCDAPDWPTVPDAELDLDGDTFVACAPWSGSPSLLGGDCDDDDGARYPFAIELCDGIDNDCAGGVDDDAVPLLALGPASPIATEDPSAAFVAGVDTVNVCGTAGSSDDAYVVVGDIDLVGLGTLPTLQGSYEFSGTHQIDDLRFLGGIGSTAGLMTVGGAITVDSGSTVGLNDVVVACTGNFTIEAGGGIYTEGDLTGSNLTVTGCSSSGSGGGIYAGGGSLTLTGTSLVSLNDAVGNGGGVFAAFGATADLSAEIDGNTANGNGGGLYLEANAYTVSDAVVTNNSANNGAGVWLGGTGAPLGLRTILDTTVSDNTAVMDGGGLYLAGTHFTLTEVSLVDNSAGGSGGGLLVSGGASRSDLLYAEGNDASRGCTMETRSAFTAADSQFTANGSSSCVGNLFVQTNRLTLHGSRWSNNGGSGGSIARIDQQGSTLCDSCTFDNDNDGPQVTYWDPGPPITFEQPNVLTGVVTNWECNPASPPGTLGEVCVPTN